MVLKSKKNKEINFTNILKLIVLIFILLIHLKTNLISEEVFDSRGTDFWLTFLPNYHNNKSNPDLRIKNGDSLYIFITSDKVTNGTITYYDKDYQKFTYNFQITNPTEMHVFKVAHWGYELEGYNNSGEINNTKNYDCETISPKSFHIETDQKVTVYAHSQANTTSDAFLVLPKTSLGKRYLVMSYNSNGTLDFPNSDVLNTGSTPSQFAIVATEDSTLVTIRPSDETRKNKRNVQQISLNQGDVYLVQANITAANLISDLTGTDIVSSKPIALFGGQQRSKVPVLTNYSVPSRDILIEQIPPVSVWGKSAFLVPYIQTPDVTSKGYDIYRVLAAFDSTLIYINGVFTKLLNKGEFLEGALTSANEITSNTSILVAQYKKTAQDGQGTFPNSDPFMMIIPPKEQFKNFYRIINVQSYEFRGNSFVKVYNYQYITIVTPDSNKSSIRIDGNLVNQNQFVKIGNTNYSYGHFATSDGVHEVSANGPFGIMIYGYGPANSYGYIGGMNFKPLDFQHPKISYADSCFRVFGIVHDSSITDSHLDKVYIEPNSEINAVVELFPINNNPSIAKFNATIIDKFNDGKFSITAIDSSQLKSTFDVWIPGFTVGFENTKEKDTIIEIKKSIKVGRQYTSQLFLYNYGRFEQEVTNILSKKGNISISSGFPYKIKPSENLIFYWSAFSNKDTVLIDTLIVENNCYQREIVTFEIKFTSDKEPPKIISNNDPCFTKFLISVADSLESDYGIDSINILFNENCYINILKRDALTSNIEIDVLDQYKDAFFKLEFIDSVGNKSYFSDTIPGFTISYNLNLNSNNLSYFDFGPNQLGNRLCKSFILYNYGEFEIIFDNATLFRNIEFSFPQSQFPLKIRPKDSVEVVACFNPIKLNNADNLDTLKLYFKCLSKDIILIGHSDTLLLSGKSKCNLDIKLQTTQVPFDYFIDGLYPNPASTIIKTNIGVPSETNLKIDFYNSIGELLIDYEQSMKLFSGIYELAIKVDELKSGLYFIVFRFDNNTLVKKIIINN